MATDHERAVTLALRASDELLTLFGRAGTADHPRGIILSTYRSTRRELANTITDLTLALETLGTLRLALRTAVWTLLNQALLIGQQQSAREAELYNLPNFRFFSVSTQRDNAFKSIMAKLDAQISQIEALIASGMPDARSLILGDSERVGLLTPKLVIDTLFFWITSLAFFAWEEGVAQVRDDDMMVGAFPAQFKKQAVAVVDNRTTDCCLRVHGQVADFDKPFALTGTPRFADKLMSPPFHWFCRTTVALIRAEDADDDFTKEMKAEAKAQRGVK